MRREPRRPLTVSGQRKGLYYGGMAVSAVGFVLFLGFFFSIASRMTGAVDMHEPPPIMSTIIGFIMIGIGQMIMRVGARGAAGSGLVLDPDQAHRDLEPWARMGGRLVDDATDEIDVLKRPPERPPQDLETIKVRCRGCRALNDEDARFCDQCGQPV